MLFAPNKVDIFTKDLTQIATYFLPVDREVSENLLTLNDIIQSYIQWDNVLQTKTEEIEKLWLYITEKKDYLSKLGFKNYDAFMNFIAKAYENRSEIYTLLGKEQAFNYLVLLENGNEKRPNGWFFWSFAFITLNGGHLTHVEVVDSYFPDFIAPTTRLSLPSWTEKAFGTEVMGFISANKFWFTNMDGERIKILYERMFNETYQQDKVDQVINKEQRETLHNSFIKGIFFLNSHLINELLPSFTQKERERQFINASVDLIRWEVRTNKKEVYIQNVMQYFDINKFQIIKNLINNRKPLTEKKYLNVYLSNISTGLQTFLQESNFNTVYSDDTIYTREINSSYNKSDGFISKESTLLDSAGKQIFTTSKDEIPLSNLSNGDYTLQITYDFNVPENYITFIRNLEQQYEITLTERENHILVLWPVETPGHATPNRRENKGTLYFPSRLQVLAIRGDIQESDQFETDFSKGLRYLIGTNANHTTKQVFIDFKI